MLRTAVQGFAVTSTQSGGVFVQFLKKKHGDPQQTQNSFQINLSIFNDISYIHWKLHFQHNLTGTHK